MNEVPIRILYVDDEPVLLNVGKLFLEKDGMIIVDTAVSIQDALDCINSTHYDVIVSDYEMQEMDGIQFLRHLKKMGNQTPFIVFTGRGREEVVIEALNCGADFYIQKGGAPKAQFTELSNKIRYAASRKRTENLLKESEERYRSVVEDQSEFICRFLPDGTHVFVNEAYCRYFEFDRKEIIGSKFKPKMPLKDNQNVGKLISSLTQNNPFVTIEQQIYLPDGSTRWQRWVDRAIFDTNGKLKEYQSVGRDITELKERELALNEKNYELRAAYEQIASAEEELRQQFEENKVATQALHESEKKFQGIVHGSPTPQFVIDKDHKIISWNKALEKYSRINAEEVLGTTFAWRAFYEKERPVMADLLIERNIDKIPLWYPGKYEHSKYVEEGYEATDFFPHMGTSGVWLFFTASTIKDSEGNIIGAVETLEDITDRKLNEESLKESEERYRTLVVSVNEAIILQEKTGEIVTWNTAAEKLFGVTAMEMVGHTQTGQKWKTIHEDGTEFLDSDHPSMYTLATGEAYKNVVMGITSADGRFSWVNINTSPLIRQGDSKPYAVIISLLDITERKKTEESLIESEELYRTVVENSYNAVYIYRDHHILFANKMAADLTGYTNEELLAMDIWVLVHPDDRIRLRESGKQRISGRNLPPNFTGRIIKKSGKVLDCEFFVNRILYQNQPAILGIIRDITEQKEIETALRKSQDNFRMVLDHLPDLVLVHRNGIIQYVNPAMIDTMGISPDQVMNKSIYDYITPEYHPRIAAAIQKRIETGLDDPYEIELLSHVRGRRIVLIRGSIIEFDNSPAILNVLTDITEQRHSQHALQQSEEKFRSYVENANDIIYSLTPDGIFTYVSPTWTDMLGHDSSEVVGKSFDAFIHINDLPACHEFVQQTLMSGEKKSGIEYRIRHKEGIWKWHTTTASPIRDSCGNIVSFLGICHDITERKRAEDTLRRANRQLNLLNGITRHDINNQLTMLQGYLSILEKKKDEPRFDEYFQKASIAAQRISSMIRFTKEYEQIGVHSPSWQNVHMLVNDVAKEAPLEYIKIKNDIPVSAEVFADPLFVKVCYNLMDNAIRYGGKITTIRFYVEECDEDKIIVCEDDGNGVPIEDKERIFERGYGKNTGLGLSLSREILGITGITICEKGEQGKGARFEITVPNGKWRFIENSL